MNDVNENREYTYIDALADWKSICSGESSYDFESCENIGRTIISSYSNIKHRQLSSSGNWGEKVYSLDRSRGKLRYTEQFMRISGPQHKPKDRLAVLVWHSLVSRYADSLPQRQNQVFNCLIAGMTISETARHLSLASMQVRREIYVQKQMERVGNLRVYNTMPVRNPRKVPLLISLWLLDQWLFKRNLDSRLEGESYEVQK